MTEIHNLFGRHADKNEVDRIVRELLKIKGVTSETTETAGRPTVTVVWTAN